MSTFIQRYLRVGSPVTEIVSATPERVVLPISSHQIPASAPVAAKFIFAPVIVLSVILAFVIPASSASFDVEIAAPLTMLALFKLPLISLTIVFIGVL